MDESIREAMKTACEDGDFDKVFELIEAGQNPNHSLPGNRNPLHYAAYHGNLEAVRTLVKVHGYNPQCVDKNGYTPLHYVCYGVPEATGNNSESLFGWHCPWWYEERIATISHFEVAKFLLTEGGCRITKSRKHRTKSRKHSKAAPLVLHLACRYGTVEFVKFLIEEHNCCVSITNLNGDTVVHVASKYGHVEILKWLSEKRHCSLVQQNKDGNTPLHLACKYQHFEVVQYLVSKQPNLAVEVNKAGELPTHLACMQVLPEMVKLVTTSSNIANLKAHNGATPLHVASSCGSLEVVKFLIEEMHCESNVEDNDHITALDYACGIDTISDNDYFYNKERVQFDKRNIQVVEYLVGKCGCDPMKIRGKFSPMQIACNYRAADNLALMKALTIKDVNCLDSHGNTPLHLACRANQVEIVKFLVLEKHCRQGIKNDTGELPLHIACSQQSLELVKLVSNCDVNAPTKYQGDTPIHIACSDCEIDVVAYLTQERQCDLNIPNTNGELPLHIACGREYLEMVKLVSKCDLHVQTKSGFTPLHIACEHNALAIIEYLVQEKECAPNQYPHLYDDLLIHCACTLGGVELVRKLANSANVNLRYPEKSLRYQYSNRQITYGNTPLHEACKSANVEVVTFLVEKSQCDQSIQNQEGELPLHLACGQRSLEIVKLVSHCDVNCQTKHKQETPLHIACREEVLDTVRYLTQMSHCDMTLKNYGQEVPLHIVCSKQSMEMVQLVSSPLVYNITNKSGDTPLQIACKCGRIDFVRYLTENYVPAATIQNSFDELPLHYACQHSLEMTELVSNCDVECRTSDGATPLHIACKHLKLDIVRYLIEKKSCNPDIEDNGGLTPLDYACGETGDESDIEDNGGLTPLDYACGETGDESDVEDYERLIPLHYACGETEYEFTPHLAATQSDRNQAQVTVVKYLMNKCDYDPANVISLFERACKEDKLELAKLLSTNADVVNSSDAQGNTPLHIACMRKKLEIVKFLTEERKCNQRIKNKAGELPLHIACECECPLEIVKLVSNCDNYINAQTKFGNTPLHIACTHNETSFKVVEFLTKQCQCDQTIQNINGELPLHIACRQNSLEVVKLVSNCNCNAQTKFGDTPLHIACEHNEIEVIQFLTEQCQCDQTIQNQDGELPLHTACSKNSTAAMKLVSSKCDVNVRTLKRETALHYIVCRYNVTDEQIDIANFLVNSRGADSSLLDGSSKSLIHTACMSGNLALVKILVASTTVNSRDMYGNTPLHIACDHEHIEIAEFLVKEAPVQADLSIKNNFGNLALHAACEKRSLALVKLVSNCNPDIKNCDGNTPVHIACIQRAFNCVKYLVRERSCNISVQNEMGQIPLHIVSNTMTIRSIKLVSHCAVNSRTATGDTPLHIACRKRNKKIWIVKYLLKTLMCDPKIQNKNGELPLHIACSEKSLELVKYLSNCDPNMQTVSGDTPLHRACKREYVWVRTYEKSVINVVRYLTTEMRCDCTVQNKKGELPLHIACEQSFELVQLVSNCNINSQTEDGNTPLHIACNTPLHIACMKEKMKIIEYLTETKQCDKNIQNQKGELPLHIACAHSNLEMAKKVCECNVNAVTTTGDTPLHLALSSRSYAHDTSNLIAFLISKGCDVTLQNNEKELPLHIACKEHSMEVIRLVEECDVNARTETGDTPLHFACRRNSSNIVERLVKVKHSELTIQNNNKELPLHIACCNCSLDVVKIVSDCNASLQTVTGDTPLHIACRRGIPDIVEYLIKVKHCSPGVPNNDNELPLHIACKYIANTNFEILTLLCECNVNTKTFQSGDTPLHYACRHQHYYVQRINIVKYLIQDKLCDPTIQNGAGQLPLHIACSIEADSLQLVELLTKRDADFNCKTHTGDTPLHEACKSHADIYYNSKTQVVRFLVEEKHCNPNLQNKEGMTPLHYACKLNAKETIKYLLSTRNVGLSIVAKDSEGNTPIMLTDDIEIIRELLKHGADPQHLYQRYQKFFRECSSETPPPTPLKVLVLGNASTGKSTLIESLKAEGQMVVQHSDPNAHTAGIIPNQFKSKEYGLVTFYDFAGQHEYYAGHEAVFRTIVRNTPPVILLLVNVNENEDHIKHKILYWLSFSNNQFSTVSGKPHFTIVGSHADLCCGDPQKKLGLIIESLRIHFEKSTVNFIAFSTMDCRVSESQGINNLRCHLQKSSKVLGDHGVMNFRTHYFHVYLLAHFRDLPAVSLNQVTNVLIQNQEHKYYRFSSYRHQRGPTEENNNPKGLLPTKPSEVDTICEELSEKGHIVFLKNFRRRSSWVILNEKALFGEVNGTIFAPVGFKQHKVLASNTGVVTFSKIAEHFPNHDPNMIVSFLSHLEFCHVITDEEVMSLVEGRPKCFISSSSSSEPYFFFPHLVSVECPQEVWRPDPQFDYQCGWILWCSEAHHFFTARFLQVILLRLAFTFALNLQIQNQSNQPTVQRHCSVWKNGISWLNRDGIETLVEVRDQNKAAIVMMRCIEGAATKIECVSLRSSIIQKIMEAKEEFCSKLSTTEFFIDPRGLQYPPGPLQELTLFSMSTVARSVVEAKPCVICDGGSMHMLLELEAKLLHFEPYADLGEDILKELFNEEKRDTELMDEFLYEIADMIAKTKSIGHKKECLQRMFDLPCTMLQERIRQAPEGVTHELVRIFQLWRDRSKDQTYGGLRQKLDEYSVFCGRNPLELASEEQGR